MNNIDPSVRSSFFPKSREAQRKKSVHSNVMKRNSYEKSNELKNMTQKDAKVDIMNSIKDFSRIKRAVDTAPDIDNSQKIADLKARINSGSYSVDYDELADKMLMNEF